MFDGALDRYLAAPYERQEDLAEYDCPECGELLEYDHEAGMYICQQDEHLDEDGSGLAFDPDDLAPCREDYED